jgi:hypothetical protein
MSLFKYYQEALNVVNDGGLASLADVETNFNRVANPNVSNTSNNNLGIPIDYVYNRARVPGTYNPDRRPGSRGQRYFSDSIFLPRDATADTRALVKSSYEKQANDAYNMNLANRLQQQQAEAIKPPTYTVPPAQRLSFGAYTPRDDAPSGAGTTNPVPTQNDLMAFLAQQQAKKKAGETAPNNSLPDGASTVLNMQSGGIASLARGGSTPTYNMGGMPQSQGYYLGGATDGMADKIPARIDNDQEARLSDGEFVVPADVVSHLGNGNSSAGAKNLYGMMNRVRQARTGSTQQGKQIDPNKFIPSR